MELSVVFLYVQFVGFFGTNLREEKDSWSLQDSLGIEALEGLGLVGMRGGTVGRGRGSGSRSRSGVGGGCWQSPAAK